MDRFEKAETGIDKNASDVDVTASGYERMCSECETYNKEIEWRPYYTCNNCDKKFPTNEPEHAMG